MTVHLVSYQTTRNDATPNVVSVSVDGNPVSSEHFGTGFDAKYPLGDKTIAHNWSVQIDALGTDYDRNFTGASDACTPPPPVLTASAAVNATAATCDIGEKLELGAIENAAWEAPVMNGNAYSVTARATGTSLFADGTNTQVFEGTLAGPLPATDRACITPPPTSTPIKPADTVTSDWTDDVDCDVKTVTRTTTTITTGTELNTAGDAWVATTPVSVVTTAVRPSTAVNCPVPVTTTVDPPTTTTPVVPTATGVTGGLVTTGVDLQGGLIAAGALLAAGIALLIVRARRRITA